MATRDKSEQGLRQEHPLPSPFEAKTDFENGTVEISGTGVGSVTIGINSYASAANALSTFWYGMADQMEPGTTLEIKDTFSGKATTVVAGAIADVAAVIAMATKRGKYVPDQPEAETFISAPRRPRGSKHTAATKASSARKPKGLPSAAPTSADAVTETPEKRKRGRPKGSGKKAVVAADAPRAGATVSNKAVVKPKSASKKSARGTKADTPFAAAIVTEAPSASPTLPSVPKKRGRPPKSADKSRAAVSADADFKKGGKVPPMPSWFKSFSKSYEGDAGENGSFMLERTPLVVRPDAPRTVLGKAPDHDGKLAWGWEVVHANGKHVAWVIAEGEKALVLAGIPGDEAPQPQRVIDGVIARIMVRVMPKVKAGSRKAA